MPIELTAGGASYIGCSAEEQAIIQSALTKACDVAKRCRDYLNGIPIPSRPDARYLEWFGAYDATRYATVTTNYDKIADAFCNKNLTFRCHSDSCQSNWYAYVYANRPYGIFLCNRFWTAGEQGIDSKMGTLIHEMSHFTVVAGTQDFAYGVTACKALAGPTPRTRSPTRTATNTSRSC